MKMKLGLFAIVLVVLAPMLQSVAAQVYTPTPYPVIGQSGVVGKAVTTLSDTGTTTSGTTQNLLYTLNSVTVPAGAFGTTGQVMTMEAWGNLAVNANAKDILVTYAGITLQSIAGTTLSGSSYYVRAVITRAAANTQRVTTVIIAGTTILGTSSITPIAAPDSVANAWTIQTRNTAAAALSGTGMGMVVTFSNQ